MNKLNRLPICSPNRAQNSRAAILAIAFCLFFCGHGLFAQGGTCDQIAFNFVNFEPCRFRLTYDNSTDCYTNIFLNLDQGSFQNFSANAPAGFQVTVLGPASLMITHANGFLPFGFQGPLIFTLPVGLVTTVQVAYDNQCAMESCILLNAPLLESCPDPMNASIIGVKYRECNALPYSNQPTIEGWTIELQDSMGNVLAEQVTNSDGEYAFFDLQAGSYRVREIPKGGWTATVPASGQVAVNLNPSQERIVNFGNCPSCSCDDLYTDVIQLPFVSDTCAYALNVSNTGDFCFNELNLTLQAGSFASVIPAAGWTATFVSPQHYKLTFPPNFIPAQSFQTTYFSVTGAAQQNITVSSSYNTGMGVISCSRSFSYQCPPPVSPPPCCPSGTTFGPEQVLNGDFSLGNQFFTNDYSYFAPGTFTSIGAYSVLDFGQVYQANSQWACIDHTTYTTAGPMLIVDGYAGPTAWRQQVNVTAGTRYSFEAWVNNLVKPTRDHADPQMALYVDNQIVAGPLTLPENPDLWMRLCDTFTAQQTGLVTLSIRMLSTASIGNDVAIDDVSLRACMNNPCIEDFETGGVGQWVASNGTVAVITDPITGSMVLNGDDGSGASWMYNSSTAYNGNWIQKFNNCLCFDIRYDNVDPANPAFGTSALTIYQGLSPTNFIRRATFVATPPIGNTWTRVCVPIGLSNGIAYPSNQYGQWTSTSLTDFDILMQNVSGIAIVLDFGGGTSPTELLYVDNFCVEKCSGSGCECRQGDVTFSTAGSNVTIPCQQGPNFPVFFCPTGPVTISGDFGCVDAAGNPCPAPPYPPIDWILFGPNGIVQQGAIITGSPWSLPFTAADLAGSGFYSLYMTTLCPGQVDSCKCVATWFQECVADTCECGPNPWDLEFRYGGAQNQPVQCGDTLDVTTGSAFYPKFICQGPPGCGKVDWVLTDPNGGIVASMVGVVPNSAGVFVIPSLQPTNFPSPGTYTLQMIGICGQDTCPCTVYFCLPPPPPNVNDASICKTLQSVYIPLQGCPTDCDIAEVQWFVKPGSASNWPPLPYQVSSAGNPQDCDDLLFLPYQYPNEATVQVYAVIKLDPGCCLPDLTSNIATITLCNPIACSITNPNTLGFCQTGQPQALTGILSGANCNYTVEWYNEAGQLVSNSLIYTPPVLTFPSNSTACYKDFVFTLKVIGICGPSTCSTSIRVFNNNADNGDLKMDPLEPPHPLPLCPGEDARLTYTDRCSGPPPKWQWYSSIVSGNSGYVPIPGTGMMNPIYYTNQLYQTTWFMVESQNGVCPPQQDKLKIEIKDAISIVSFTAVPDPCIDQQVVLTVGFTPSPIAGPNCQYIIDWYQNGNLIHTSTSLSSPVSYTHFGPGIPGVYYAVVRDNCCPASVQTWPVVINAPCKPVISGPCYKCDMTTPATLFGDMVLPPQDPCPANVICTYQWYVLDVVAHPDVWVLLPGETGSTLTILKGGHYKLETTCDYGYGPCIQEAFHDVAQCMGCMFLGEQEIPLPAELKVNIHPNPTAGSVTVQINSTPLRQGRVEIVDVNGKLLATSRIPEAQSAVTLSLAHLPTGLYFARVLESDVLLWTGKVVRSE